MSNSLVQNSILLKIINNFNDLARVVVNISIVGIQEAFEKNGIFSISKSIEIPSQQSNTLSITIPYITTKITNDIIESLKKNKVLIDVFSSNFTIAKHQYKEFPVIFDQNNSIIIPGQIEFILQE